MRQQPCRNCASENWPCWNWAHVATIPRGICATTEARVTHSMILFVCFEVLSDVAMYVAQCRYFTKYETST